MNQCKQCNTGFRITQDEQHHREALSPVFSGQKYLIPDPTLCSDCRMQRRMTFRNERKFYKRKCDATGETIVSIYSQENPSKVYGRDAWWSDKWDGTQYGRDFDFTRPFFTQFVELWRQVPMVSMWIIQAINSEYNNNCFGLKDSYMNVNTDHGERNFYSYGSDRCTDIADCTFVYDGELCYECLDSSKAYQCFFSQDLENCSECWFCSDLARCRKCFGCSGLRDKELYIFNEKATQAELDALIKTQSFTPPFIEQNIGLARKTSLGIPKRATYLINCENCTGDYLVNCKNVFNSFDIKEAEELKNVIYAPFNTRYVQDAYAVGDIIWGYEILGGGLNANNVAFINNFASGLSFSYYCVQCLNGSDNLFGCVGLKKKQYCIFNKQYSREEYEALVPRIIEHMRATGEWGEFFPSQISPFGYNETIANERYPMDRDKVLSRDWRWREEKDEIPDVKKIIPSSRLPECITEIPDEITDWAITCSATGRPFRITPQELKFYRKLGLPIPRFHPDHRHKMRMTLRRPHKIFDRICAKCGNKIKTTYNPELPEIVYCEACYLKTVY